MSATVKSLFLSLGISTVSLVVCSENASNGNLRNALRAKTLAATEKNRSFDNALLSAGTSHNAYLVQTHNTLMAARRQECREQAMVTYTTAKPVQKTSEQKQAPTVMYTAGPVVACYCNNVRAPESLDQVKSMLRLMAAADERIIVLRQQAQPTYNKHKNPKAGGKKQKQLQAKKN